MKQLLLLFQKKSYLFSLLTTLLCLSFFISYFVVTKINKVVKSFQLTDDFNTCVDNTNKTTIYAKEFLLTAYTDMKFHQSGRNLQLDLFDEKYNKVIDKLNTLKASRIDELKNDSRKINLEKYRDCFYKIVSLTKEKGYKDLGIEGQMRDAVHSIEGFEFLTDLKPLLTLRRHEKDFLLRKDLKYKESFDKEYNNFIESIRDSKSISDANKILLQDQLSIYNSCFNRIVNIETQLGFSESVGLRKELASLHKNIDDNFIIAQNLLKSNTHIALANISIVVWIVTAIMVVFISFAGWMYFFIRKDIQKPLSDLNNIADKISKGNLNVDFGALTKSLFLSELSVNTERIVKKFRDTISLMEVVSKKSQFLSDEDFLPEDYAGQVLIRISKEIESMTKEQEERNWQNESIAQVNVSLKEHESLKLFCEKTTNILINILKANQAALFLVNEENGQVSLNLSSAYAYNRKKFMEKAILPGEGLVGQCYLEKESSFITEIPQNYLKITSGLGDAQPNCLYIMPLIHNEEVQAVFEIASFKTFKKHEIIFMEKVSESIASAIYFMKVNEKTRDLLTISGFQTEQLRAQEEEMRQNIEELSATQEQQLRQEIIKSKTELTIPEMV